MNARKDDYSWVGWIIAAVIVIIFVLFFFSSNNNHSADASIQPTSAVQSDAAAEATSVDSESWHCVDATSFDHNAYNDNKCIKGSEMQYVSDSQAVQLDSSYSPGKAGAAYYNNQ